MDLYHIIPMMLKIIYICDMFQKNILITDMVGPLVQLHNPSPVIEGQWGWGWGWEWGWLVGVGVVGAGVGAVGGVGGWGIWVEGWWGGLGDMYATANEICSYVFLLFHSKLLGVYHRCFLLNPLREDEDIIGNTEPYLASVFWSLGFISVFCFQLYTVS